MMRQLALAFFLILFPCILLAEEPVYLSGFLIKPALNSSRFTFILSKKTYGRVKYIPRPDRIEIEFENTYRQFNMQKTQLTGNVKSVMMEDSHHGILRFIFNVNGEAQWEIKFLPNAVEGDTRLQLTIITPKKSALVYKKKVNTNTQPLQKIFQESALNTFNSLTEELNARQIKNNIIKTPQLESVNTIKKPNFFTIVIDAGHGGKDPGALGARGTKEKDVVLNIAKKLANTINERPNMRAILTRNGDYFVPLRGRLKLARKGKADLFVAIHADAYFDNDATGASVFALSQHGASNEAARWLAQRDNYSELGGVELDTLQDRDPILRSVLVDLAQTATIQDSIYLGNRVLDALDEMTSLHYSHVERAPFVVLKSPDIPSILVETGFLTNPKEEKRLVDARYQEKLARALCRGIDQYVQKYARR